jgi:hypothetical protein
LTEKAQACAIAAHRALYCQGYSRTDMILKDGRFFVLETNTIPGMTATSLFPQSAQAAGMSFSQLLDRLIELGMAPGVVGGVRRKDNPFYWEPLLCKRIGANACSSKKTIVSWMGTNEEGGTL